MSSEENLIEFGEKFNKIVDDLIESEEIIEFDFVEYLRLPLDEVNRQIKTTTLKKKRF